jgi:hypothetical protein
MKKNTKQYIYWTPRVLCILMAAFLGLFSFDVFEGGGSFGEQILGFLIHNIPVYVVVIVLIVAWKREWVGGIAFLGLAALYMVLTRLNQHWSAYAVISGGLVVISILFFLNWKYKNQLRERE